MSKIKEYTTYYLHNGYRKIPLFEKIETSDDTVPKDEDYDRSSSFNVLLNKDAIEVFFNASKSLILTYDDPSEEKGMVVKGEKRFKSMKNDHERYAIINSNPQYSYTANWVKLNKQDVQERESKVKSQLLNSHSNNPEFIAEIEKMKKQEEVDRDVRRKSMGVAADKDLEVPKYTADEAIDLLRKYESKELVLSDEEWNPIYEEIMFSLMCERMKEDNSYYVSALTEAWTCVLCKVTTEYKYHNCARL